MKAASVALTLSPVLAFAQTQPPQNGLPDPDIDSPQKVIDLICTVASWFFAILVVVAIIFILAAAFNYLTARGDAEKVGAANQSLIYAAVAVAVAVLARAIPLVVSNFLGAGTIQSCP